MSTISKSEARQLAKQAAEMNVKVLQGKLIISPEGATIDGADVTAWLAQHADQQLILVAAPVRQRVDKTELLQSCHTCGRDYRGDTCPYCAEARARLRGQ